MPDNELLVENSVEKSAPLLEILKLKLAGISYTDIGKQYGVTPQAIHKRIKGIFKLLNPDKIQAYKDNKINLLTAAECELLDVMLEPSKLKRSTTLQLATAFGIVYDKGRLESGKSTANISYQDIVQERRRLEAELEQDKPDDV